MRIVFMVGCAVLFSWLSAAQAPDNDAARTQALKQALLDYWQSIDSIECDYTARIDDRVNGIRQEKVFFKFKDAWIWHLRAVFKESDRGAPWLTKVFCETNLKGDIEEYYCGEVFEPLTPTDLLESPWRTAKGFLTGTLSHRKKGVFQERKMGRFINQNKTFRHMYRNDFNPLLIAGKNAAIAYSASTKSLRNLLAGPGGCSSDESGGELRLNFEPELPEEENGDPDMRYRLIFHLTPDLFLKQVDYLHYPSCTTEELARFAVGNTPDQICNAICWDYYDAPVERNGIQIPTRMKRVTGRFHHPGPEGIARRQALADQRDRGEITQCEMDLALRKQAGENIFEHVVTTIEFNPDTLEVNNPDLKQEDFALYTCTEAQAKAAAEATGRTAMAMSRDAAALPTALKAIKLNDLAALQETLTPRGNRAKITAVCGALAASFLLLFVLRRSTRRKSSSS